MFFSHLIQPWLLQPGLSILFGILAIAFWYQRNVSNILCLVALFSLWLSSTPLIAYKLTDSLQDQSTMLSLDNLKNHTADAIVILGGGDSVDLEYENKHVVSEATFHRVKYGAYLHHKTGLPIIVSGGRSNGYPETEADLMAETLRDDFNIKKVIKEDKSNNTAEESQFLLSILKQNHFNTVYLVTNAWHMPRSMYVFKRAGIKFIPAPMGYISYKPDYYSLLTYFPSINALDATTIAMHEYIGFVWYLLNHP